MTNSHQGNNERLSVREPTYGSDNLFHMNHNIPHAKEERRADGARTGA